jgi:hypothetical protein
MQGGAVPRKIRIRSPFLKFLERALVVAPFRTIQL